LGGAARWLGDYRRFWDESLDQLDDYVQALKRKERGRGSKSKRIDR
jgi:hypothetical protein